MKSCLSQDLAHELAMHPGRPEKDRGRETCSRHPKGSTAPFAYHILYLCWLKDDIPRPLTEPAFRIDRFHPPIQRRTLGEILRRVLALDFRHSLVPSLPLAAQG